MKCFVFLLLPLIQRSADCVRECTCTYNYENGRSGTKRNRCACLCRVEASGDKNCCAPCCFHGDSNVTIEDGSLVKMKHLTVGQKVLTVENGKRTFTEVKTFLKRIPLTNVTHRTFTTEKGNDFSVTEDHLIFMSNNNKTAEMRAEYAMLVKRGDYIFLTLSCPSGLCPERVVDISFSEKPGLYAPLTDTGTLVVDGVLASNYVYFDQELAHYLMIPFRWFPWLLRPWEQDGWSPILKFLASFSETVLPFSVFPERT